MRHALETCQALVLALVLAVSCSESNSEVGGDAPVQGGDVGDPVGDVTVDVATEVGDIAVVDPGDGCVADVGQEPVDSALPDDGMGGDLPGEAGGEGIVDATGDGVIGDGISDGAGVDALSDGAGVDATVDGALGDGGSDGTIVDTAADGGDMDATADTVSDAPADGADDGAGSPDTMDGGCSAEPVLVTATTEDDDGWNQLFKAVVKYELGLLVAADDSVESIVLSDWFWIVNGATITIDFVGDPSNEDIMYDGLLGDVEAALMDLWFITSVEYNYYGCPPETPNCGPWPGFDTDTLILSFTGTTQSYDGCLIEEITAP